MNKHHSGSCRQQHRWWCAGLFVTLIALPVSGNAAPHWCQWLVDLTVSMVSGGPKLSVPKDQLELWRKTFSPNGEALALPAHLMRSEEGRYLLWWRVAKLPDPIRDNLLSVDSHRRQAVSSYLLSTADVIDRPLMKPFLLTESLFFAWREYLFKTGLDKSVAFGDWAKENLNSVMAELTRDPYLREKLEELNSVALESTRADIWWRYFMQTSLRIELDVKGELALQLGERRFTVIRKDKNTFLVQKVPRALIRRPGWNPYDAEHAKNIAVSGLKAIGPLPCEVGLDGAFWLMDKNHRFHMSTAQYFDVEISRPARTVPLRIFKEFLGGSVVRKQDVLALYRGEASLDEFLTVSERKAIKVGHFDHKGKAPIELDLESWLKQHEY